MTHRRRPRLSILALSDTRGLFPPTHTLPDADLVVHAGDITDRGADDPAGLVAARHWMSSLVARYGAGRVLYVPGERDVGISNRTFEPQGARGVNRVLWRHPDHSEFTVTGVALTTAYHQPLLATCQPHTTVNRQEERNAFTLPRVDLLISHGPPFGVLDRSACGQRLGSAELLELFRRAEAPRLVICGHVLEGSGRWGNARTEVHNVAGTPRVIDVPC